MCIVLTLYWLSCSANTVWRSISWIKRWFLTHDCRCLCLTLRLCYCYVTAPVLYWRQTSKVCNNRQRLPLLSRSFEGEATKKSSSSVRDVNPVRRNQSTAQFYCITPGSITKYVMREYCKSAVHPGLWILTHHWKTEITWSSTISLPSSWRTSPL